MEICKNCDWPIVEVLGEWIHDYDATGVRRPFCEDVLRDKKYMGKQAEPTEPTLKEKLEAIDGVIYVDINSDGEHVIKYDQWRIANVIDILFKYGFRVSYIPIATANTILIKAIG